MNDSGPVAAMTAAVQALPYGASVALGGAACATLCIAARRCPGPWMVGAACTIGAVLMADAVSYAVAQAVGGPWSAETDLPLALCNMAVPVAAAACVWRVPVLVELTWFWGLAGALQAVVTPDLDVGFPRLVFFQYVVGHVAIVTAALFLVVGMRITPRPGAVWRTFAVTVAYTAFVGIVDWISGANYMFLRHPPSNWTVLRLLGPWPWYIAGAAALGLVLLALLNLPFWYARRRGSGEPDGREGPAIPVDVSQR
jgi:hypothetical integral membrane protein (TIGR02206 family)